MSRGRDSPEHSRSLGALKAEKNQRLGCFSQARSLQRPYPSRCDGAQRAHWDVSSNAPERPLAGGRSGQLVGEPSPASPALLVVSEAPPGGLNQFRKLAGLPCWFAKAPVGGLLMGDGTG